MYGRCSPYIRYIAGKRIILYDYIYIRFRLSSYRHDEQSLLISCIREYNIRLIA